jgi:hypothetical protein
VVTACVSVVIVAAVVVAAAAAAAVGFVKGTPEVAGGRSSKRGHMLAIRLGGYKRLSWER